MNSLDPYGVGFESILRESFYSLIATCSANTAVDLAFLSDALCLLPKLLSSESNDGNQAVWPILTPRFAIM
jgi:hypothetical protein